MSARGPGARHPHWQASALLVLFSLFARPAQAATWFLLGGGDRDAALVEPIDGRRVLICGKRCDVWTPREGTSTPTDALDTSIGPLAHVRLPDGSVLVVGAGAGAQKTRIWTASTGHWRAAAPLPEAMNYLRLGALGDGRVVAVGTFPASGAGRAYLADRDVRAWSLLVDIPKASSPLSGRTLVPCSTGVAALDWDGDTPVVSRFSVETRSWTKVSGPSWPSWPSSALRQTALLGDDAVFFARSDVDWKALVLAPSGEARSVPPFATGGGLRVEPITTAGTEATLLLDDGAALFVWRQSEPSPRAVRRDPLGAKHGLAAVDDGHLVGVGPWGTVGLLSLDDRPPAGGACDGLERFLRRTYGLGTPGSAPASSPPKLAVALGLADADCRRAVARGEAAGLVALARQWSAEPDPRRSELGRLTSCAIQDGSVLDAIPRWLGDREQTVARPVCIAALVNWPGADQPRRQVFDGLVQKESTGWQVDPALLALLAVDQDPLLRDELVPALQTAQQRHALGLDRLHEAVCARMDLASPQRTSLCAAPIDWSPKPDRRRDDNHLALRRLTLDRRRDGRGRRAGRGRLRDA